MSTKEIELEKAFSRLEEILELIQEEAIGLDKSLALYEEANKLIELCGKQLSKAEQKVEKLLKNRDGSLALDNSGGPLTEDIEDEL